MDRRVQPQCETQQVGLEGSTPQGIAKRRAGLSPVQQQQGWVAIDVNQRAPEHYC